MTDDELTRLAREIESERVERKESPKEGDKMRQAVCAFANDLPGHGLPGVLFVGIDDKGSPTGLSITDELLRNLAAMRDDGNIVPPPSINVRRLRLGDKEAAAVIVQPSSSPPVRYDGRIWIRSGPRRGIASADDERILSEKRRFRDLPFDAQPINDAELDALDETLFKQYLQSAVAKDVLERNNRSFEEQLIASKFAHPGPPVHPTTLGILTVGKSPSDWVPGAYVQFLRIDGVAHGDPIKNARELRGPLPELLLAIEDVLKNNLQTTLDFTSSDREISKPDYPIVALQQITRNAVLHRTYEGTHAPVRFDWFNDRIEIQSPGGPFGRVKRENFGSPYANDYRNPNLAAAMKELGFVQRFGYGIQLARAEMEKNGNPPPEFLVEDAHVAVILRRRP